MKNNKILIAVIVFLLLLVWAGAFHMYNSDRMIEWNMMHNMMVWNKMDMWKWVDDKMKEHCKMMPEMEWCENYKDWDNKWKGKMWMMKWMWEMDWKKWMWNMWGWETFDTSVEWLPEVKKSEIIKLKDWDTYEMSAYAVKQEVGNRTIKRLSYNGMIPGPIIQVEKGAKIKLKFTNKLWIETTLHSHGLRLDDSKFDGLPTTMWGEQKPMKPGESFTYELDFPDTWVYWYHPHIREDYTQEMWLYGNYSVTEEDYWNSVDKEEFMILDDFSTNDEFYKDKVTKTLMGRFGNLMMINNDENYELKMETGDITRLFITNVANTRTFDFSILDSEWNKQKFKLVWWDVWRIEKETMINSQIIAPAERYIVETYFNTPGVYTINSRDRVLWKIIIEWEAILWDKKSLKEDSKWIYYYTNLRENNEDYKYLRDNFDKFLKQKVDKKLRLTIWMNWMKGGMWGMGWMKMDEMEEDTDEIEWEDNMAMMNKMSNDQMMEWKLIDEQTKKENMDIEWKFKKGDFVKVEIYNDPNSMHPMQHPIHFHGQRFVVLSRDGKPNTNLQWKDTTLVKNWEKIEILIEMTNVWTWMSHCHIAEHLQSGMMMTFRVEEK